MTAKEITRVPISPLTPPPSANKHRRYRMNKYLAWVGPRWLDPKLNKYRDFLLDSGLKASTVKAHLCAVRVAYRELLLDRDLFFAQAAIAKKTAAFVEKKLAVDEMIIRITNAISPDAAKVKGVTVQDIPDAEVRRLTKSEADELLRMPGIAHPDNLRGLRDTALIAIALCTGVREFELVAIRVSDLYHTSEGEPALLIPLGKGRKKRTIPYGELEWCVTLAERWMTAAGITAGPVFRGFWKGCKKIRPTALTTKGVENILRNYPLNIAGKLGYAKPHDLRRTYARLSEEAGMKLLSIQQNLGHSRAETTIGYIGTLDAQQRRPPAIFADVSRK